MILVLDDQWKKIGHADMQHVDNWSKIKILNLFTE